MKPPPERLDRAVDRWTILDRLVSFVLPSHCYGCDAPLSLRSQEFNLCASCLADLPRPDDHLCRLCGAFTATDCWLCLACGRRPSSSDNSRIWLPRSLTRSLPSAIPSSRDTIS